MENKKTNIVEQINRGYIRVNTIQEFNELIEDFPDDPAIHKAYADLLVKKKSLDKAASSYGKAAKNSEVKINFPNEGMELKISGKIAWTRETIVRGKKTLALSIQFQDLSPKLRGMLFVFAENSMDQ